MYAKSDWRDFDAVHLTDLHIARRIDGFRATLLAAGRGEAAAAYNNYNDNLRDFVRYANHLHAIGRLDLVLATGDLVDYLHEDGEAPESPGNFGLLRDILLGVSPYADGRRGERLRVPMFMTPGNHDYRAHSYPLLGKLTWGDFARALSEENLGLALVAGIGSLFGSNNAVTTLNESAQYDLSTDELRALVGVAHGHPTVSPQRAARAIGLDPSMKDGHGYYWHYLAHDHAYLVALGNHRIVMLDSRWDAGLTASATDLTLAKLGYGSEDRLTFVGGGPNSVGPTDLEANLVEQARQEASGVVIVGIHAPLFDIAGAEYNHYFRETEHAKASEADVKSFFFRQSDLRPGVWYPSDPLAKSREHQRLNQLSAQWPLRGTPYFKKGTTDLLLDDGVARGAGPKVIEMCQSRPGMRRVDLVLCGHGHRNVEYTTGREDPEKPSLNFLLDFYTENPPRYYPSKKAKAQFYAEWESVHVRVATPGTATHRTGDTITVPGYGETLAAADVYSAGDWWRRHAPVYIQTAALGPLENRQRPDTTEHRYPFPGSPYVVTTDPLPGYPTFQGFRHLEVRNDLIQKIRHVSLQALRAAGLRQAWE